MASVIDFSALTLNNEEARSSAEVVFEQAFFRPELERIHGVQTGVEMDKYIPIFGKLGLVGKVDPGSCGVNSNTGTIPTSQKTWTPKLISDRLTHCQANLPDKLKFWKKSRIAANTWEEIENEAKAFTEDMVMEAIKNSQIRIAEFSKTTLSPVGDATGDETLTAGTTKTYFNMLNGMWAQLEADAALAPANKGFRYIESKNSEATKTAQLALSSTAALDMFRALYNGISPEAFESGNLTFQITKSYFDNWQDLLEDKSLVFSLDRTEQGATKWQYRGIPIVIRYDWDRIIKTYFDNGTTYYLPHRALLADINNIPIGTSDSESLGALDSFYDKVTKSHYIDFAYKIDCKVLVESELAYAF